jgi:hypothetical protein
MLGHSPGFTATALAVIALDIGANSALFSVVNAVLLKPLPYRDADRLVRVMVKSPGGGHALVGLTFDANDDRPGSPRVAVIGDALWRRRFGADWNLAGKTIAFEDRAYDVIGVIRPGFATDPPADMWLPLQAEPHSLWRWHSGRCVLPRVFSLAHSRRFSMPNRISRCSRYATSWWARSAQRSRSSEAPSDWCS